MLHIYNKKASVSSNIVVGHVTRPQNEHGLSKYLIVHEQLCSIRHLYFAMSIKVSEINQISRGNALLVGGKSTLSAPAAPDEKTFLNGEQENGFG